MQRERERARETLPGDLASALRAPLEGRRRAAAADPPGAASAALAVALARDPAASCVLAVLAGPRELEAFAQDAAAFLSRGDSLRVFPMLGEAEDDPEAAAARAEVLRRLRETGGASPRGIVATCVQALLQPSPDPELEERASLHLAPGAGPGPEALAEWLAENGYRREPEVYERGVFARKGGILDLWPPGAAVPSRVEFFGDEAESLRTFDPATQRSDQRLESLRVPPARPPRGTRRLLHELLPPGAVALWRGGDALRAAAEDFAEAGALAAGARLGAVRAALDAREDVRQVFLGLPLPEDAEEVALPVRPVEGLADAEARLLDPAVLESRRRAVVAAATEAAARGRAAVRVCLDTEAMAAHVRGEFAGAPGAVVREAPLTGGFAVAGPRGAVRAVWLSQADLFGRGKPLALPGVGGARTWTFAPGGDGGLADAVDEAAAALAEEDPSEALATRILDRISPGDIVVHAEHGIGRYLGTSEEETGGGARAETMVIEYAEGSRLHVPLTQAHLVSRYTGVGDAPVKLHALGSKRWANEKLAAARSVQTLAAAMLRRQARRKELPGRPFARETPYLEEFEASFPYRETSGQLECIRRVLDDMAGPHPMDRLVCGDAGYGKTEVALRAAFVCAMQGRQVAVLVPTTVLAQQHYELFRARFAPYPVTIALHSRFATPAERAAALRGAADGSVDVLVGTHGILGPDVRFRDLGLVVIDEEQRFGVREKERLKEMCEMVDVLTLSATPIPRSLYLGLSGARDLSLLRTPPPGRVAVETHVVADSDETVREAILREVARGGQVFYLHNRVMTIQFAHERLRRLVPHLRIAVAHGRLPPRETERVVGAFAEGRYDVLLSTTIVENGIDIPRANTILVDRADRFGIADLYQLRGRVGRGATKAYAYFLVPREALLTADAKERLEALAAAKDAGCGVALALRDLSIRGAGNLLGAEQSGHISAIGFGLYCQLLRRAVARLRGEPPPLLVNVELDLPFLSRSPAAGPGAAAAFLPYEYVADDARRIELHRRLAECSSEDELRALEGEIADRFGAPPDALARLFRATLCRILAAERGISRVRFSEGLLYLYRGGAPLRRRGRLPAPSGVTPDELLDSVLRIVRAEDRVAPPAS